MWLTQRFTAFSQEGALHCHGLCSPGRKVRGSHVSCPDFYQDASQHSAWHNQEQECISSFSWYLANPDSVPTADSGPSSKRWLLSHFHYDLVMSLSEEWWRKMILPSHSFPCHRTVYLCHGDHTSSERLLSYLWVVNIFVFEFSDSRTVCKQFFQLSFDSTHKEEQIANKRQLYGLDPEDRVIEGQSVHPDLACPRTASSTQRTQRPPLSFASEPHQGSWLFCLLFVISR